MEDPAKRVYTRDQLVVSGSLNGEAVNVIVNHWPSRSGGEAKTNYRRENAAALNKEIIDSLYQKKPYSKIISMGDFNDGPDNKSFKKVLKTSGDRNAIGVQEMYNPMEILAKNGKGSLAYRDGWNLFDQILISESLLGSRDGLQFYQAGIFNMPYLIALSGQYKGYPFRSYDYSDIQPFKWNLEETNLTIIGSNPKEESDFNKTWIVITNKSKKQVWKSTDGSTTVQVLELNKK